MNSNIYIDDLCKQRLFFKEEFASFINRWQWEWFASLSLGGERRPVHFAEQNLKRWRGKCSTISQLQISYIGVLNHDPYSHIHLFMRGHNKRGETLLCKSPTPWEYHWPENAKVKEIYDQEGAIDYVVKKNMPDGQYELLSPYGMKHLQRFTD